MKGKRGQGHVEVIISFSLFISFVMFMLFFFRPVLRSGDISLNNVENTLKRNLTTNLDFFSMKIPDPSGGRPCVCFDNPYPGGITGGVIAKNVESQIIGSWRDGGEICIEHEGGIFFYVYSSEEFENIIDSQSCDILVGEQEGLLRSLDPISNSYLTKLKTGYEGDYNQLRASLRLTQDFRIDIFDSEAQPIFHLERSTPLGRPVYSRDVPVEVINVDGELIYGIMRVYAW